MFVTHPQNQFIHNEHNAVFECVASGSESLNISWTKNGEHIGSSHLNEVSHGVKRSVLKVDRATVDDSGVYQCIGTNAVNETVLSESAELLSKIGISI